MIKINKTEAFDTGDGCVVTFLDVTGIRGTVSIGITSDCYVGYNCPPEEVQYDGSEITWAASSVSELGGLLGYVNAQVIINKADIYKREDAATYDY